MSHSSDVPVSPSETAVANDQDSSASNASENNISEKTAPSNYMSNHHSLNSLSSENVSTAHISGSAETSSASSVPLTPIVKKEVGGSSDRFWNPRMWDGMTISVWLKALAKGHFAISPLRFPMFCAVSLITPMNSSLAFLQRLVCGRKIAQTSLVQPPVFIVGHWRSGTTLLHEYMIRDDSFTFSDTYTCFAPSHFLISGFLRPAVSLLMPKKRPIDNMLVGLERPQEDEFALCALGLPSTYLDIMFPNNPPINENYLTLQNISDKERKYWQDGLEYLLKALTVERPKRVILKSPTHTARIKTILERFPDAKFIHINRNPFTLFASTYNLWIGLSRVHGLQIPKGKNLEEFVFRTFERMYTAFDADIELLRPEQYVDVSYENLTKKPVSVLETIYQQLELPGFESVRSKFEAFAQSQKSYKKNKFTLREEIADEIARRWSRYIDKYGYKRPEN